MKTNILYSSQPVDYSFVFAIGNTPEDTFRITMQYEDLTAGDKAKWDAFKTLLSNSMNIVIENTALQVSIDMMGNPTPEPTTQTLDYNAMSASDKAKYDDFIAMAKSLIPVEVIPEPEPEPEPEA